MTAPYERTRLATVVDLTAAMLVHLPMESTVTGDLIITCEAEGCDFRVAGRDTPITQHFVVADHAARVEFQRHVLKAAGVTDATLSTPVDNPVDRVLDAHLRGRLENPGRTIIPTTSPLPSAGTTRRWGVTQ